MDYNEWMQTPSKHSTPRLHAQVNDPARDMLKDHFVTQPKVYRETCYICKDMEFARMGMPLCNLCCNCASEGMEGHIAADDNTCEDCSHVLCQQCVDLPPQKESICSCNNPCCEVDVGVGVITCGSQHCPTHGSFKNES